MLIAYYIVSGLLIAMTLMSFVNHPHWTIRMFDFLRSQVCFIQGVVLGLAFFLVPMTPVVWALQGGLFLCIIMHLATLSRYLPLYPRESQPRELKRSQTVKLLTANVLQYNTDYPRFLELIYREDPDIFVTLESDEAWEKAMDVFEPDYPYYCKIAKSDTYGMHLYSRLPLRDLQVHHFMADDVPSIETCVDLDNGFDFTLYVVHPPPPSPTEENDSKERDGELMTVAKRVGEKPYRTVVAGDFNQVAWGKNSRLFKKVGKLIDPRIGRGIFPTFHAQYRFMRFPIDQLYHTSDVFVKDFGTLPKFGSDHLPLFAQFYVAEVDQPGFFPTRNPNEQEMKETAETIEEGKAKEGERGGRDTESSAGNIEINTVDTRTHQ